jgi:hypothetical protein
VSGAGPPADVPRRARGRELLDAPDAPLADPVTAAPPRFLPEYDDVLLSHADRARVHAGHGPGLPFPRGAAIWTLLVDGFYRANWKIDRRGGRRPARVPCARERGAPRRIPPEPPTRGYAAVLRSPSASSTTSSWVLGDAFGITWRTTPSPSMMNVARALPM